MTHKNIKIFCGIAILLFLAFILRGRAWKDAISYAVTISALIEYAYDRWIWRWNLFDKTPRIYGEYDAVAKSTFDEDTTYPSRIIIKQTLSSICVIEKSADGDGESISASLFKNTPNGPWQLCYTYVTVPKYFKRLKNDETHRGTVILCLDNLDYIEGYYFTDRPTPTGGEVTLKRISK